MNFNGTAGMWRRAHRRRRRLAARHAHRGPRPQLSRADAGWKFVFLPDLVAPAELPVEMNAFKTQQHRWAKGSVQTCKKLLPTHPRVRAALAGEGRGDLPPHRATSPSRRHAAALRAHVPRHGAALQHGLGRDVRGRPADLPRGAPPPRCAFYAISQREQFPTTWKSKLKYIPAVLGIGMGISINNAIAVIEGLFGSPPSSRARPSTGSRARRDVWKTKIYKGKSSWVPYAELGLACYFTFVNLYALTYGLVGTLPFIALFQWGFLYTSGMSLAQSLDWLDAAPSRKPDRAATHMSAGPGRPRGASR